MLKLHVRLPGRGKKFPSFFSLEYFMLGLFGIC